MSEELSKKFIKLLNEKDKLEYLVNANSSIIQLLRDELNELLSRELKHEIEGLINYATGTAKKNCIELMRLIKKGINVLDLSSKLEAFIEDDKSELSLTKTINDLSELYPHLNIDKKLINEDKILAPGGLINIGLNAILRNIDLRRNKKQKDFNVYINSDSIKIDDDTYYLIRISHDAPLLKDNKMVSMSYPYLFNELPVKKIKKIGDLKVNVRIKYFIKALSCINGLMDVCINDSGRESFDIYLPKKVIKEKYQ